MKKFKGFIAALIAMTTVMSSMSMMAFADEGPVVTTTNPSVKSGGTSGTGEVEGIIDTEVFDVVLPTVAENATTFNFILDPQGLLAATNGAAHSNASFASGKYLFFANAATGGGSVTYSDSSDVLTAYNLSNEDVTLTVKGTVTNADGITFTKDAPLDDKAQIQLKIAGTSDAFFETKDDVTTATLTETIAAVTPTKDSSTDPTFVVSYSGGKYSYALDSTIKDNKAYENAPEVSKATFKLTGAASKNDDGKAWAAIEESGTTPKVDLTWEIKSPFSSAPSANANVTANSTALTIPFDLGSGDIAATGIAKVECFHNGYPWSVVNTSDYTVSSGQITFTESASNYFSAGALFKITFNDAASTVVDVKVVAAPSTT